VQVLLDGEAIFDSGDISGRKLQTYTLAVYLSLTPGSSFTIETRVEGTGGVEPAVTTSGGAC